MRISNILYRIIFKSPRDNWRLSIHFQWKLTRNLIIAFNRQIKADEINDYKSRFAHLIIINWHAKFKIYDSWTSKMHFPEATEPDLFGLRLSTQHLECKKARAHIHFGGFVDFPNYYYLSKWFWIYFLSFVLSMCIL